MQDHSAAAQAIRRSGLFDVGDYVRLNGLKLTEIGDPLDHYLSVGEAAGHRPNALFDPAWYAAVSGARAPGLLLHYAGAGERAGLSPSAEFDAPWYRERHRVEAPLAHYLAHRRTGTVSPNRWFDPAFFAAANPDLPATPDPYAAFVERSVFEGRRPSAAFDPDHVRRRYLGGDRSRNPFLLFLRHGAELGWTPAAAPDEPTLSGEIARATRPGANFEETPRLGGGPRRALALAFYLPQFHPIPENDRWWGRGFTEWRNVARGIPRFPGHHQPRVPRDLGHYDLSGTAVLRRQAELARGAGLHGFCFHYYNFNGHRLLEKPLDAFLAEPDIALPFCLMWANENWTRRWDGRDREVLIAQDYRPADDAALVADLARHMLDPRYIRVAGRPLLFLYRADVIPDTAGALRRWRALFELRHGLRPLLVIAQTFGTTDPRPAGFDAAVEFPPHKVLDLIPPLGRAIEPFEAGFEGDVRSYDDLVEASLAEAPTAYPLIRTVVPGWDNEARRPGRGLTIQGSTPAKFGAWTEALLARIEPVFGERLLCVNAWNEWAEAAYLEPDLRHGFAYLNALSRSLSTLRPGTRRRVVLVGHDAQRAGAQMLLHAVGRTLVFRFGVEVAFVLMGGGPLAGRYADLAPTYVVDGGGDIWPGLVRHLHGLRERGFSAAIVNSAMSGHVLPVLAELGFATCSLVHEMPTLLARSPGGPERIGSVLARSDHVVFPSAPVREAVADAFGAPARASRVVPQGLYGEVAEPDPDAAGRLRAELGLEAGTRIVLNAGIADLRKGIDRFVAIAEAVAARSGGIAFVWLGDAEPAVETWLLAGLRADEGSNLRFVPFTEEVGAYLAAADLFLLTSREDPFPSVILEALAAGVPVAALRGGGGYEDLLADPALGFLLPANDVAAAADALVRHLAGGAGRSEALDDRRRAHVAAHYDFARYVSTILNLVTPARGVSVIVPVTGAVDAIEARLASVFDQGHPVFEIIVLDDGTSEARTAEIERVAERHGRDLVLVEAGGPASWTEGFGRAGGDLVWIAEAETIAEPGFLDGLVTAFDEPDTCLAFCETRPVEAGARDERAARGDLTLAEGRETLLRRREAGKADPDLSATVWRRTDLARALAGSPDGARGPDRATLYERASAGRRVGHTAEALCLRVAEREVGARVFRRTTSPPSWA